jgi:hypothetical protein
MTIPEGQRGSWFAVWKGELLPCIHKHWVQRQHYADPDVSDDPRWLAIVTALQEKGKAILTDDELGANGHPVKRKGYIGVYKVANVVVRDHTLHLDLVARDHSF